MKLLKTIRLDPSDAFVFERAAATDEWAVPGSFLFWNANVAAFTGKKRSAFRAGFLGIESFGFSTLATVAQVDEAQRDGAVRRLAEQLVAQCGAPDLEVALAAAREEVAFAESLADHPPGTLIALHRALDGHGAIREQFRTLKAGQPVRDVRAFTFVESDGEPGEAPQEAVDLQALIGGRR